VLGKSWIMIPIKWKVLYIHFTVDIQLYCYKDYSDVMDIRWT